MFALIALLLFALATAAVRMLLSRRPLLLRLGALAFAMPLVFSLFSGTWACGTQRLGMHQEDLDSCAPAVAFVGMPLVYADRLTHPR
jgi:hypothetical protein